VRVVRGSARWLGAALARVLDVAGGALHRTGVPRHLNRFQIARLRRASRRTRILLGFGTVALATAMILPVATGRTQPRWYRLQAAKLAVERAKTCGAEAWAAEPMQAAEAMLHVARVEHRHQELRFYFLRDFTQSEALLRDAETRAERATQLALVRQRSARNASEEAVSRAAQSVGRGVGYAKAINLGAYDRRLLQKSKLRLQEAEILHRHGRFDLAGARARDASGLSEQVVEHAGKAASRFTEPGLVRNWRRMIDETITASRLHGESAIIVYKEKHLLTLYHRGQPVRSYPAEMGYNLLGMKSRAGDLATPEGRYRVVSKKPVGQSAYHMALLLDYPNAEDRRRFDAAKRAGLIHRKASLGGLIEIHGEGGLGRDWTKGCVALRNSDMADLFARVGVGTRVTIVGGDGKGGLFTKFADRGDVGRGVGMD
jgi:hypothetical protein